MTVEIKFNCPTCSKEQEHQVALTLVSASYGVSSVPLNWAGLLEGRSHICNNCGCRLVFKSPRKRINFDILTQEQLDAEPT